MADQFEILLVEDYRPDAQLLLRLLKKHQILNKTRVVWDGAQALDQFFGRWSGRFNSPDAPPLVIILDIRLPKVDGWEVLRRLKAGARTAAIPVIMVSGCVSDDEREKARQLGAIACLSKPVRFEELEEAFALAGFSQHAAVASA
jgi:two-component system response regulator